jgi:hypothetical protein
MKVISQTKHFYLLENPTNIYDTSNQKLVTIKF